MPLNQPGATAVKSGTYTGDNSVNRAIPHGLPRTPRGVIIAAVDVVQPAIARPGFLITDTVAKAIQLKGDVASTALAVTAMDSTNFYVGNATGYSTSANVSDYNYFWVAIG